jgi:uncharacterized integral membrane protein (TIGR00697 family)
MNLQARSKADISTVSNRRNSLLLLLAGFFLTNALLAELIGGKLFQVPTGMTLFGEPDFKITLSCGIVLWPVVFIMTDIINEYFGRSGVKRLSFLAAGMIAYAFVALWATQQVRAASFSPVDDASFSRVFMQSQWIIVGSIAAFLLAQLLDVTVFWLIRRRTGHRMLWLRATGSTVFSQLIDTIVVQFIGLHLPYLLDHSKGVDLPTLINSASSGYAFKLCVAIAVTPLLYLVHAMIDRYLGEDAAEQIIEATAAREHAADST